MKGILLTSLILLFGLCSYPQATEIIKNGTFDNTFNWTTNSYFEISSGAAHFDGEGIGYLTQPAANMVSPIKDNTTYILTFDITPDAAGGTAYMRINSDANIVYVGSDNYEAGSNQIMFTTGTNNSGGIRFYVLSTSDPFSIDNISLIQGEEPAGSPYFISLTGHDGNDGSIDSPFATPERAFSVAEAGDSIYIRAGTYYRTQNQGTMAVSVADGSCNQGEPNNIIFFGGYPPDIANGDSVIFDFSLVMPEEPDYEGIEADPPTATPRHNGGFSFSWINYLHLKDFTIRNVWQKYRYVQVRGMNFYACNYLRLENLKVYNIGGQGIFSANGTLAEGFIIEESEWIPGDTTYVINVDAYRCIDSLAINVYNYNQGQAGSWGQGFFMQNHFMGEYLELRGCRAWQCADDGNNNHGGGQVHMFNCWSFNNGIYLPDIDYTTPGNGFKVNQGGSEAQLIKDPTFIHQRVTNCIAAYNEGTGFRENHVTGQISLNRNNYNNLAYKNNQGFTTTQPDPPGWEHKDNRYINNIAYDNTLADIGEYQGAYFETEITNSWDDPPGVTVTDADFLALPTDATHNLAILSAPRKADGSLPDIGDYFKLSPGSGLIDAGTDVGLPYYGSAPDIGPFEYDKVPETNNKYPTVRIISPLDKSIFNESNNITISAEAEDPDGIVSKVEFLYEDTISINEVFAPPWSIIWDSVPIGRYHLRAVATDDEGAKAYSAKIGITVLTNINNPENSNLLFPNPNNGSFTLALREPLRYNSELKIISLDGRIVYQDIVKQDTIIKEFCLSFLTPGLYILTLFGEKSFLNNKFIKL
jgi:hypothetical protein